MLEEEYVFFSPYCATTLILLVIGDFTLLLRALPLCPLKELEVAIDMVVLEAMSLQNPANGNQAPIPIIFCFGKDQMPLALGARKMLRFRVL